MSNDVSTEDCLNPATIEQGHPSYQEHIERYRFAASLCFNKRVLDIACGSGYGAKLLLDSGAAEVIGADISANNINFAKSNFSGKNLSFVLHDIATRFQDEFDVVVSFETIEHVSDDGGAMRTLFNATKSGGFLLISSPNRSITNPYLSPNTSCNGDGHVREYTIDEFRKLFLDTGFVEIALFGQRMQRYFGCRFFEKHYKRLFKPSKTASPAVSQVRDLSPEYFIFLLAKPS